jgi:hypothetical protein
MTQTDTIRWRLMALTGLIATAMLVTAEARTRLLDSWQNPEAQKREPQKIAVIAVLPDALLRQAVEIDLVKMLQKKGRTLVQGTRIPGLTGGIRGKIDTKKATAVLEKAGVDGVIVLFYTGGGVTGEYQRSDYWLRYEGSTMGYGYSNWGQPWFVDVYSVQKGEGYSDYTRTAWVETSYYDLESREAVWRIVTETRDIEHSDATKGIGKRIAAQMRKTGRWTRAAASCWGGISPRQSASASSTFSACWRAGAGPTT